MRGPVLTRTRTELSDALAAVRARDGRVALVPTMGALHDGHRALVQSARELVDPASARELVAPDGAVVVSIFVNPMQFAAGEDLATYPRTLEADLRICAAEGVDVVFAPGVHEVYPTGEPLMSVEPGPLGKVLEGSVRPAHFRGMLTVVAKLFGLVRPDLAVFGQKDYQQLVLIQQMATDLCLEIEVVGADTVRESDGLALSSRNEYLTPAQRILALTLSRALSAGFEAAGLGAQSVLLAARDMLRESEGPGQITVDYLELTSPDLGAPPAEGPARLLVAAQVGSTRLIDNVALVLGRGAFR